jgi:uncharacterized protein
VKLHPSLAGARNTFTGYGEGYVLVNGTRHEGNLIVLPEDVLAWEVAGFDALESTHFGALAALAPEVVLLGTGRTLRFPRPALSAPLIEAGIGMEVMDVQAACRTYNILIAESRRVAAALLLR